jgi:NADPH-dependent glutamate synthase beta subunit-like oxidoreductase
VNCQGYVHLIARGDDRQAMETLREALPFPETLSRICSHPCEDHCHHKQIDGEAVAIRALKRYLVDHAADQALPLPETAPETGYTIAVVGSGPAGMMAAYDLRVKGHAVVIYEADDAPGGMLRWAIPGYKLPTAALERDLAVLHQLGVAFKCGTTLGKAVALDELCRDYDAVIVATGCSRSDRLNRQGEALQDVHMGLPFLRAAREGRPPRIGDRVVVIGGGNVAVDAAQTARRLGAREVTLVCLEAPDQMPAYPSALQSAKAEGVKVTCSWGPIHFTSKDDRLTGIDFQRCVTVFDDCGQFNPSFDSCELKSMQADTAIVAIGQTTDPDMLAQMGLGSDLIAKIDPLTLQSTNLQVFLAGDLISGPSSVVDAMAAGRRAAESVHRYVRGEHLRYGRLYPGPFETEFDIDTSRGEDVARATIRENNDPTQGLEAELEEPLDPASARQEARRCYACGQPYGKYRTCWFCLPCEVECPQDALYVEIPYLLR